MPSLPNHIRRQRDIKTAREKAHIDGADRLWARVEAERRALNQSAMLVQVLLLAHDKSIC
ncbi:hypothetical protein [Methylobacterium sp. J-070]|uniref:hypothetical protein n=1 Tax=Methylobacterium sp. J-070 TaxID=2836650 RepID=UPI001FB992E4|nr:hypothetical protein [Methylobacterium sp. J-070]MCJ2050188.1 hypothetical protein [Methylobacterium sp. J-070]